jgi:hypothetical protein
MSHRHDTGTPPTSRSQLQKRKRQEPNKLHAPAKARRVGRVQKANSKAKAELDRLAKYVARVYQGTWSARTVQDAVEHIEQGFRILETLPPPVRLQHSALSKLLKLEQYTHRTRVLMHKWAKSDKARTPEKTRVEKTQRTGMDAIFERLQKEEERSMQRGSQIEVQQPKVVIHTRVHFSRIHIYTTFACHLPCV